MLLDKEDYFIGLLSKFIVTLEKIEIILEEVQETNQTSRTEKLIDIFVDLFTNSAYSEHFEFKISLIGKSTQAMYWGERNLENSNRHLTLNLKSEYIQFYNTLYDNKIEDLIKFFRHIFSLIENFSILQNNSKVNKYNSLLAIIKEDFIYWKVVQDKALKRSIKQDDIIKAFKFLSFNTEKKINWQSFLNVILKQNINYLYHFTDTSNLESIKKHGALCSWYFCEINGITINRPGGNSISRELDKRKNLENFVRLSFVEQHPMKFVAQKEGRINNPLTLKCDSEIILLKHSLFSNCNANKREAIINDSLELFEELRFDIFGKRYFDLNNDSNLKSLYQAEVLVAEYIPNRYILNLNEL